MESDSESLLPASSTASPSPVSSDSLGSPGGHDDALMELSDTNECETYEADPSGHDLAEVVPVVPKVSSGAGTVGSEKRKRPLGTFSRFAIASVVGAVFGTALTLAGSAYLKSNDIVAAYSVSGVSMEQTFKDGDTAFIKNPNEALRRGDVVVFQEPDSWEGYIGDDKTLIKRAVAIPGDKVSYKNGVFSVNGEVVYDGKADGYQCDNPVNADYEYTLKSDQFAAFGDNPHHSFDSRAMFCQGDQENAYPNTSTIKANGDYFKISWKWW